MINGSSKSSLFLMELIMSILFFCLAAAVCVQMFVKSHTLSETSLTLNHSIVWAESLSDAFYACEGNLEAMSEIFDVPVFDRDAQTIALCYDRDFNPVSSKDEATYVAEAVLIEEESSKLMLLDIQCIDLERESKIYTLSVKYYPQKEISD